MEIHLLWTAVKTIWKSLYIIDSIPLYANIFIYAIIKQFYFFCLSEQYPWQMSIELKTKTMLNVNIVKWSRWQTCNLNENVKGSWWLFVFSLIWAYAEAGSIAHNYKVITRTQKKQKNKNNTHKKKSASTLTSKVNFLLSFLYK